jgi:hypothetical protein
MTKPQSATVLLIVSFILAIDLVSSMSTYSLNAFLIETTIIGATALGSIALFISDAVGRR